MSQRKLRELVLYVAKTCEKDPKFGMVMLNKVLFSADFSYFAKTGQSISGEKYQKEKAGPVVSAMVPVLRDAETDRDLETRPQRWDFDQAKVIPLREPDLSLFTKEEMSMVDESIRLLRGLSAAELSRHFHKYLGWQVADLHEQIPYETAFFIERTPTESELEYALTLGDRKVS